MKDYTVSSLKDDFPELSSIKDVEYLTPLLDYLINQFIPHMSSEWQKDSFVTDSQYRHHGTKNDEEILLDLIIDGKINSVMIWRRSDNNRYALSYLYHNSLSKRRRMLILRDIIRFYGPSSGKLFEKFSEFVKTFNSQDLIMNSLSVILKQMEDNACVDAEKEDFIIVLRKLIN